MGKDHRTPDHTLQAYSLGDLAKKISEISASNKLLGQNTVVSICGGSCTGKSTHLAVDLKNELAQDTQIISQDHYMLASLGRATDLRYGWDHPDNFCLAESSGMMDQFRKGISSVMENYSFHTLAKLEINLIIPSPILLFEGLYTSFEFLRAHADFVVYVEMPLYARLIRRLFRSMYERYNADPNSTLEQYLRSPLNAHREFVRAQKMNADTVWTAPYSFQESISRFELKPINKRCELSQLVYCFELPDETFFDIEKTGSTFYFNLCFRSLVYLRFAISNETFQRLLTLDLREL